MFLTYGACGISGVSVFIYIVPFFVFCLGPRRDSNVVPKIDSRADSSVDSRADSRARGLRTRCVACPDGTDGAGEFRQWHRTELRRREPCVIVDAIAVEVASNPIINVVARVTACQPAVAAVATPRRVPRSHAGGKACGERRVHFEPPIGTDYSGAWLDSRAFQVRALATVGGVITRLNGHHGAYALAHPEGAAMLGSCAELGRKLVSRESKTRPAPFAAGTLLLAAAPPSSCLPSPVVAPCSCCTCTWCCRISW